MRRSEERRCGAKVKWVLVPLHAQSRCVDFNPIAEWVMHEEAPPGPLSCVLYSNAGSLELGSKGLQVPASEPKMALNIRLVAPFLNRNMQLQPTRIEP